MEPSLKPFAHVSVNAVDIVVLDADHLFDDDLHDHYASFVEARDAALSCVELLLDEGDYDGEDHREELVRMQAMLEAAESMADLESSPDYRWFSERVRPEHAGPASTLNHAA